VIERSETVVEVAADGRGGGAGRWRRGYSPTRGEAVQCAEHRYAGNSQHVEIAYARVIHADGTVWRRRDGGYGHAGGGDAHRRRFTVILKSYNFPVRSLRVATGSS